MVIKMVDDWFAFLNCVIEEKTCLYYNEAEEYSIGFRPEEGVTLHWFCHDDSQRWARVLPRGAWGAYMIMYTDRTSSRSFRGLDEFIREIFVRPVI